MIPLKQIHITAPCHESWDAMAGDDQSRFCAGCCKQVHNLSEMTREEAKTVLDRVGEHACVRFFPGPDGRPLTREDRAPTEPAAGVPVFRMRGPRRLAAAASWAVALLTAGLGFAQAAVAPKPSRASHGQNKSSHRYRLGQFSLPKTTGAASRPPRPVASGHPGFDSGLGATTGFGFGSGSALMGGMKMGGNATSSPPPARMGEPVVVPN